MIVNWYFMLWKWRICIYRDLYKCRP